MKHPPRHTHTHTHTHTLANRLLWSLLTSLSVVLVACGSSDPELAISEGRYQGDNIAVTLANKADAWTGQIQLGQRSFNLTAQLKEGRLEGSFQDGASSFPFEMKPAGKSFELSSGGSVYKLTKDVQTNPLAQGGSTPAKKVEKVKNPLDPESGSGSNKPEKTDKVPTGSDGERAVANGTLHKHPYGFQFRYPKAWKLADTGEGILAITPDDILQSPQGALEIILVLGDVSDGITDTKDPRVATELDQQMGESFSFLKRAGQPTIVRLGAHEFSVHDWKGTNPSGVEIHGRAWACIVKKSALIVLAFMPPKQLEKRQDVLQAIAGSFTY